MHEYSVASSLLDLVDQHAREHPGARVLRVHVRLGEHCGVEPDLLRTAWDLVRERSPAAGAALEVAIVPLRWECRMCEKWLDPGTGPRCPACGGPAAVASGLELWLDRTELEVE